MKINLKKLSTIICIMLVIIVIFMPMVNVFAEINTVNSENPDATTVKGFLAWGMTMSLGPLTAALATLVNVVLIVVFTLLYFIFSPISAGYAFPFPDQIIFNKIGFFDPNFINPTTVNGSPVKILQELIRNLYYTGFVIAGTVFLIAAMVIGIKLAISTIASDKAHYKQALMTWVTGLFLLFTTHFIMLIIFTVNEQIVQLISTASDSVLFQFQWTEAIPLIGKPITNIFNALTTFFGTAPVGIVNVYGYEGLLIKFGVGALGGNIIYSIVCGIILGQTCALILMYLKRLFYSIVLGMIAPLIIAADVMKKSL